MLVFCVLAIGTLGEPQALLPLELLCCLPQGQCFLDEAGLTPPVCEAVKLCHSLSVLPVITFLNPCNNSEVSIIIPLAVTRKGGREDADLGGLHQGCMLQVSLHLATTRSLSCPLLGLQHFDSKC